MNGHERSTKQMDRTLETLRYTIQKLDLPVAREDSLQGLVRDLREYAYQAG